MPIGDKKKHDAGKLRWDLVPFEVLDELVRVYTVGAGEYGDNTWQSVLDEGPGRYEAALMRHFSAHKRGETRSKDHDLYHLACVCWNSMALLWDILRKEKIAENDRLAAKAYALQQDAMMKINLAQTAERERHVHNNDTYCGLGWVRTGDSGSVAKEQTSHAENHGSGEKDSESRTPHEGSEVYRNKSEGSGEELKEHGFETERY